MFRRSSPVRDRLSARGNRRLPLQHPKTALPSALSGIVSKWGMLAFAGSLLVALALRLPSWESVIVEPISLPEDLVKAGYTSDLVTRQLMSGITQAVVSTDMSQFSSFGGGVKPPPGDISISFVSKDASKIAASVLSLVRSTFGRDRTISGEIRKAPTGFHLLAVGRNASLNESIACPIDIGQFQESLQACARKLVEAVAPDVALLHSYVAGSAKCSVDPDDCTYVDARRLMQQILDDADALNDKWVVVVRALIEDSYSAHQELLKVIKDEPNFRPALYARAYGSQPMRTERITILRRLISDGDYAPGADVAIFTLIYGMALPGRSGYPDQDCILPTSESVVEMAQAQRRTAGRAGSTWRLHARRMDAAISRIQGDSGPSREIYEELIREHRDDPALRVELGAMYIDQTTIEVAAPTLLEFIDKAIEQYRIALKLAPKFETAKVYLEAAQAIRAQVVSGVETGTLVQTKSRTCKAGPLLPPRVRPVAIIATRRP